MIRELVQKTRSFRGFDSSYKVTESQLRDFVDCARLTASSMNIQPLKYYLAFSDEDVKTVLSLSKWAAALKDMHLPHPGKEPTAFIVICQDLSISPNTGTFQKDVGIVAQTILLAASEQGLGGCCIGNFNKDKVKEALSLPQNVEVQLILAVGRPDEKIVLVEAKKEGSTAYYRDENDVHYVPKRALEQVLLN
ncbi:nitroreductase family protein [Treponema zioleckii]|uniref:nitroreductase family protein n=1 Tax=Treponema zioleckii TaxID=331680 RepID=UPI00168BE3FD|nr:nitroreductase family protein [Treponema zioleckii]